VRPAGSRTGDRGWWRRIGFLRSHVTCPDARGRRFAATVPRFFRRPRTTRFRLGRRALTGQDSNLLGCCVRVRWCLASIASSLPRLVLAHRQFDRGSARRRCASVRLARVGPGAEPGVLSVFAGKYRRVPEAPFMIRPGYVVALPDPAQNEVPRGALARGGQGRVWPHREPLPRDPDAPGEGSRRTLPFVGAHRYFARRHAVLRLRCCKVAGLALLSCHNRKVAASKALSRPKSPRANSTSRASREGSRAGGCALGIPVRS
jgi:hypothetical protein